jgi:hypothetical protein
MGGSISYNSIRPDIDKSSVIFRDNQAIYGPDLASYPYEI